jgi:hypothetical protein
VAANAVMLLGIGLVVALVVIAVVEIIKHWKSIVHGVEEAWDAVYRAVSKAVSAVVNFVKSHWQLLLAILLGPIAVAVLEIAKHWATIKKDAAKLWSDVERVTISGLDNIRHWIASKFDQIRHQIASWGDDVLHWFEGLPGKIGHALASLPGLLFDAGKKAISMLINGLKSIPVVGTMISIAGDIADHLPHSPAKKGPLSGSGSPDVAGQNIARMLTAGLASGRPGVQAAMAHLTSGGMGSGGAGMAGAGAGGTVTHVVQLQFAGGSDDLLTRWFREKVRTVGGGSVQRAFGIGTG